MIFLEYSKYILQLEKDIASNLYKKFYNQFEKLIFIGNGGSNSIASHIANDAIKQDNKKALCFSDASLLTCFINDFSMEKSIVEFLKRFTDKEYLNIFISSSGESPNIINGVKYCEKNNFNYGILTGFKKNNSLRKCSKNSLFDLHVNCSNYGIVECTHQIFLHSVFKN